VLFAEMAINREHTWPTAIFLIMSISMCICVDILQHAAPLPFLPQHLEAHGHDAAEIAAVMGGYYWSGFLGGMLITAWQIKGVFVGRFEEDQWSSLRSHILKLMLGLFIGGATLLLEAKAHKVEGFTMHQVHLCCRLVQGFLGSFLFFYAYLLSVACFKGSQQVLALTSTTISLNVAEVFGPFVGAAIFTNWGLAEAYYVLAALSLINNVFLAVAYFMMPKDEDGAIDDIVMPDERTALIPATRQSPVATPKKVPSPHDSPMMPTVSTEVGLPDTAPPPAATVGTGGKRLAGVLLNRMLIASIVCIAPAAMVKSSMEGILPLFAGTQGYDEFEVGQLFTMVSVGFILSATLLGYVWTSLRPFGRVALSGISLILLGALACVILRAYGIDRQPTWYAEFFIWLNGGSRVTFYAFLVLYGVLLGVTHTAPALYLGEVLDGLGEDSKCKEAANGIWNTAWEFGGSIGFIAAGQPDTDSWRQQTSTLASIGSCVIVSAMVFFAVSWNATPPVPIETKGRRASLAEGKA
jgi:hypothetical protein